MTSREIFINTVEQLIANSNVMIPTEAIEFFNSFKATEVKEKPLFTENGAQVLQYMKDNHHTCNNIFKAKEICVGLFWSSSRTVSGAMRKLITDGYVSKIAGSPVCYSLTDLGMSCEIPSVTTEEV